jgi:P27 family predicted phage terminase small subunit
MKFRKGGAKVARPRQPIDLLLIKGKKHLTKKEIEERKSQEVKAPSDKVKAPSYLPKDLKKEFNKIAKELVAIGIMTNLDVDALARFLLARKMYLQVTDELLSRKPIATIEKEETNENGEVIGTKVLEMANGTYSELLLMQDKLFKQCRQAASDLGLTIASRCKLVIPKKEEPKEKTEEEKLFGDAL